MTILQGAHKCLLVGLIAGLTLWSSLAFPQSTANPADNLLGIDSQREQSIIITADRAELDNKQHIAIHRGNVVVKRGDLTLYSNEIKTLFDGEAKRIKQIDARGGVKLVHLGRVITAEVGTYFDQQQKIILSGNPVCTEGDNVLSGSRIIYFMQEDKIVVEDAKSTIQSKTAPNSEAQESKL